MKKTAVILFAAILMFSFFGCNNATFSENEETLPLAGDNDRVDIEDGFFDDESFFISSWLSYVELLPAGFTGNKEEYENYIDTLKNNMKNIGVTDVFVQVRPFCDAVYPSAVAVSSASVSKKQGDALPFDFLSVIISEMKEADISVHAWINPYRVQNVFDEEKLSDDNIAKKWLNENSTNVLKVDGGLYLNPCKAEVQKLIIDTADELLSSYDIKGIHIDDYFYPNMDEAADKADYESYKADNGDLSLFEWRRENVSSLIRKLYTLTKSYSQDKVFSISPGADIDKNENILFADVKKWVSEEGFCDMIIPQIYFGFDNDSKPFYETAKEWKNTVTNSSKLVAGLALYKAGKEDAYAGSGKNEWVENSDILKRQTQTVKQLGYDGICIYSASYINFNENSQKTELQNLKDVLL